MLVMRVFCSLIIVSFLLLIPSFGEAKTTEEIINDLNIQLSEATTPQEKSRLHIYRARNHLKIGKVELAEADYNTALKYDQKGWIHLERAKFYLNCGKPAQARKEAEAAVKKTPTLSAQANKIAEVAEKEVVEVQQKESPKTILLTKRWNVTYKRTPAKTSSKGARKSVSQARSSSTKKKVKKRKRGKT